MPRERTADRRRRAERVLAALVESYPDAATELDFGTPLPAPRSPRSSRPQATDVSVNAATPALFERYPDARGLAAATPEQVEPFIKTIGLFRNKAKNTVAAARRLVELHGGEVPDDFDELLTLPGVGRKTANVVVSNAFGRPGDRGRHPRRPPRPPAGSAATTTPTRSSRTSSALPDRSVDLPPPRPDPPRPPRLPCPRARVRRLPSRRRLPECRQGLKPLGGWRESATERPGISGIAASLSRG